MKGLRPVKDFTLLKPLMPVGVDHKATELQKLYQKMLLKPLMPVGVDHLVLTVVYSVGGTLLKPLMPVGVDHALKKFERKSGRLC